MVRFLMILSLLFVTGCSRDSGQENYGLTPMPSKAFEGPSDEVLAEDVAKYVAANGRPANSTYKHHRIDLNDDKLLDAIVLFQLPHQVWCGWDGCGMAIFQAGQKNFVPIASMSGIRGPIYILEQKTNGWRDIIIRISGTRMRDRNVQFRFDGSTYPKHPLNAPTFERSLSSVKKVKIFR